MYISITVRMMVLPVNDNAKIRDNRHKELTHICLILAIIYHTKREQLKTY